MTIELLVAYMCDNGVPFHAPTLCMSLPMPYLTLYVIVCLFVCLFVIVACSIGLLSNHEEKGTIGRFARGGGRVM